MKRYNKQTEFFGLPVPCNEALDSDVEMRKMQIIENQLLAGTKGVKCAIFEEGEYLLEKDMDKFAVLLLATGNKPSINGILNGGYFEGDSRIIWDGLEKGYMHYLYVKWNAKTFASKNSFRVFSTKIYRESSSSQMLVATLNLRNDNLTINTSPDGKIYAYDISFHANDNTNPHGKRQYQDQLVVRKKLLVDIRDESVTNSAIVVNDTRPSKNPTIETNAEMILKDKRSSVQMSDENNTKLDGGAKSVIGAINNAGKNSVDVVDFISTDGGALISIGEEKTISAIQVHQKFISGVVAPVGEVAIGYYSDGAVGKANEAIVFNNGQIDVPMRAIIYYN